jgi:hypothetical protein
MPRSPRPTRPSAGSRDRPWPPTWRSRHRAGDSRRRWRCGGARSSATRRTAGHDVAVHARARVGGEIRESLRVDERERPDARGMPSRHAMRIATPVRRIAVRLSRAGAAPGISPGPLQRRWSAVDGPGRTGVAIGTLSSKPRWCTSRIQSWQPRSSARRDTGTLSPTCSPAAVLTVWRNGEPRLAGTAARRRIPARDAPREPVCAPVVSRSASRPPARPGGRGRGARAWLRRPDSVA